VNDILAAQEYARPTVARILRAYPNDVLDVLQEAAIRALRGAHLFKGQSSYRTWFYRIAVNSALMHLRANWRLRDAVAVDFDAMPSNYASPEEAAIEGQRADLLQAAIGDLSPCRQEAALVWLEGGKCPGNANKSARHHARVHLREQLQGVLG
jgi:RNA polymerase sigma-70 factor (ECF subfamily)